VKILAIDTATEACSAALYNNGEMTERYQEVPRKHAELILPMVDELLSDSETKLNQLDALAFGRGPGAFTGVRIATGVAQGLAYAAEIPVIPISTLAALAQGVIGKADIIFSAIDARMQEVYWGLFEVTEANLVFSVNDEAVSKPDEIDITIGKSCFGVGTGWQTYAKQLSSIVDVSLTAFDGNKFPRARDVAVLACEDLKKGKAIPAKEAMPVYLRNKVTF
jgi:tRNA threonylcarbamoyladenosine biosynthesis protein TsaB